MNNQFSENLKKIRKENNLSQEQLADELGVSRQAISKWESAVAYPEMDKIIALCDKFNLNIDDLLHKDIKEVKGEEESKKKINKSINDFLRFITNTINLFSNMNFKSKMKCIFEQCIIGVLLFFASLFIYIVLGKLLGDFVAFLPDRVYYFVRNITDSILLVVLLIACLIVMTHIFKTRYLDYYESISEKEDDVDISKKNDSKIIIRDPKHSEYRFINTLYKLMIGVIKVFLFFFAMFIAFMIIILIGSFVTSLLLYKTGLFFIGLIVTITSSIVIGVILLLSLLNFVFNRKNDKKKMIWGFIVSLLTFGAGCGLIFIGTLSFEIVENDKEALKIVTKEYEMKDDLIIYPYNENNVIYTPSDNNNVKVDYTVSKYCLVEDHYEKDKDSNIYAWVYCENPTKIIKEFINNANEKKIVPINDGIEKIEVHTTQSNIEKLKKNWSDFSNKE